ncbi:hypothetical protein ACFV2Q_00865 [Streptomyces sp. NPDC059650]|uniref:hypothetical protein n=1 Tax=Streptomyces sp. NPDC059650 TaxID=3346896 RepID=UPI00367B40FD
MATLLCTLLLAVAAGAAPAAGAGGTVRTGTARAGDPVVDTGQGRCARAHDLRDAREAAEPAP